MGLRRSTVEGVGVTTAQAATDAAEPSLALRIEDCRSCGSPELREVLSLGQIPLTDDYPRAEDLARPPRRFPLDLAVCPRCSLVQILHTVSPEDMFEEYFYYSSFSQALLEHSRAHALSLIESRSLGADSLVVELASNDGYMLKNFVAQGIPVLGIDPARGPASAARKAGVETLTEFFDRDLAESLRNDGVEADVVIANNVLAHVPDLNGFVAGIATLLAPGGIVVIEVPYVRDLVEKHQFDTIYHEHLCYFSVSALDALFTRHGLTLNDVEHLTIHGGSLRLRASQHNERSDSVDRYLAAESTAGMRDGSFYDRFGAAVRETQASLGELLRRLRADGCRIAAYGAAAKGTVLLNSIGVGSELIDFVVDLNEHKQGRYLPGTSIPIEPPGRLLEEMPDYVLLLAWNFKDEILSQQRDFVERGGRFVVPVPEPRIV